MAALAGIAVPAAEEVVAADTDTAAEAAVGIAAAEAAVGIAAAAEAELQDTSEVLQQQERWQLRTVTVAAAVVVAEEELLDNHHNHFQPEEEVHQTGVAAQVHRPSYPYQASPFPKQPNLPLAAPQHSQTDHSHSAPLHTQDDHPVRWHRDPDLGL